MLTSLLSSAILGMLMFSLDPSNNFAEVTVQVLSNVAAVDQQPNAVTFYWC